MCGPKKQKGRAIKDPAFSPWYLFCLILDWCYLVPVLPDKYKVARFFVESINIFLKHISTKGMDSVKVIDVNKDLMKA